MHRESAILISALMLGMLTLGVPGEIAEAAVVQSGSARQITVWNGVYTEAQATSGQVVYERACKRCHGDSLDGNRAYPPLKGEKFMDTWREDNVASLFTKIKTTMPRVDSDEPFSDPGVLNDAAYLGLVAYIFQMNGLPAGANELIIGTLHTIQIEGKDGPKPLSNRSMVQLVGCMTQGDADDWMLTMAPLPTRTRNSDTTTPEELKASEVKPLGTLKFRLQGLEILGDYNPESHKGHKIQVKGILLKQAAGDRISVTSLQTVAPTCGP